MSEARKRVGVLISGGGSNMQALAEACMKDDYPAQIDLVISNKANAGGLARAEKLGIKSLAIPSKDFSDRPSHEAAISAALEETGVELVVLAGYMRIFTDNFISRWQGQMINIHPSILPLFPGLHTHQRAIDAGCRVHGCTVHFVTLGMDEGPIIGQAVVPIAPHDDADALAARVLKVEHQLYPQALAMVARGDIKMNADEQTRHSARCTIDASQQVISS